MKNLLSVVMAAILAVFTLPVGVAQDSEPASQAQAPAQPQSHIIIYPRDAKKGIPNFRNAVIAVDVQNLGFNLALTNKFRDLGSVKFNVGQNICYAEKNVVCAKIQYSPNPIRQNISGGASGWGHSGGYFINGSFDGDLYPVILSVVLVQYNPQNQTYEEILLGDSTCFAGAGSSSSAVSVYGRHGGGSIYSTSNGSAVDLGLCVGPMLDALLLPGGFKGFLRHPWAKIFTYATPAAWVRGADAAVQQAFPE